MEKKLEKKIIQDSNLNLTIKYCDFIFNQTRERPLCQINGSLPKRVSGGLQSIPHCLFVVHIITEATRVLLLNFHNPY